MGRKSKLGKGRQDKYYYLAKEQGYRSRAAFKLVQLNKKYNFLSGARVLVDLCAAPGGWLQVAAKYMPVSSIIIGVDLVPIKPIKNCITITDDITTDSCRSKLKKEMKTWLADVFIHDGAPNVGKAWIQDAYSQSELTLHSLKLATEFLTAGGTFVTKVFRSAEYTSLLYVFNQLFRRVEATKPSASRSTSAEIYVVCRGYLAPKKIDPRLLDPRFAFQEIEEHISSATALFKKRKKPNRSGYKDGPVYKQITLSGFVNGDSPVMALADNFVIVYDDEESSRYAEQKEFGHELRNLCEDLHVLSRHDFQKLLRFRDTMRKRFPTEADVQAEKEKAEEEAKNAPKPLTAEEEEEALDQKLQESVKSKAKMERRERRKKNRARTRTHNRMTLEMHHQVAVGDLKLNDDTGLFDLLGVTDGDTLQTMTEDAPANFDPNMYLSDEDQAGDSSSESEESDPEESTREKYTRLLEQEMDLQYRDYCRRRGKSIPTSAPAGMKRKERKPKDIDMWDAVQDSLTSEDAHKLSQTADVNSKNPLIVKDHSLAPEDTDATLKGWFGQDLFHDLLNPSSEPLNLSTSTTSTTTKRKQPKLDFPQRRQVEEEMRKRVIKQLEEESDSSGDERQKARAQRKKRMERQLARDTFTVVPVDHDDDEEEEGDDDNSENEERQAERMAAVVAGPQALAKKRQTRGPSFESSDDEEDDEQDGGADDDDLPDDEGSREDSESDGEEYEYELEAAQYVLAYAKNLIRQIGKIDPSQIVDNSYNRWALPDNETRPAWFAIDTSGHEKPQLPVTHQDMEEMKARAKAVDARPIKKIAEAQGRKRRRLQQKMAKLKEKAKQIASQGDLTDRDKLKAVERLVARQLKTKKTEKFYVVRTKNHVGRKLPKAPGGSRLHLVDRRMKKDKAALAKLTKQKAKRPRKH